MLLYLSFGAIGLLLSMHCSQKNRPKEPWNAIKSNDHRVVDLGKLKRGSLGKNKLYAKPKDFE
jgi:hypothetical protein